METILSNTIHYINSKKGHSHWHFIDSFHIDVIPYGVESPIRQILMRVHTQLQTGAHRELKRLYICPPVWGRTDTCCYCAELLCFITSGDNRESYSGSEDCSILAPRESERLIKIQLPFQDEVFIIRTKLLQRLFPIGHSFNI